ncbi:MAG: polysaccharide deacetylase family protein [Bacteroidia bacterium]|nr:polysaccharide deacetylase family protein [Bacteroidia bacterium]
MSIVKTLSRKIIFPAITSIGLEKSLSILSSKNYAVLAYHGIEHSPDYKLNGRHLDSKEFEKHLNYLVKNFDIVPLNELFKHQQNNTNPKRKTIALTFDDGYLNNYTVAFPVLIKYNVPATFFIITSGLVDSNFINWPDVLDIMFRYTNHKELLFGVNIFEKKVSGYYSNVLKVYLSDYIKKMSNEREELFSTFKIKYKFDSLLNDVPVQQWKLMNKEQVLEVERSGLIEVGSHTHLHYNLGNIQSNLIQQELITPKKILEELIQKQVVSIAYPDGSYTHEVKKISIGCGYKNLIAVDYRLENDGKDTSIMHRYCVSNTTTTESNMIQLRLHFNK